MAGPGETVTFHCSCGQETCHGELNVIPIKIKGEKRIDLRTIGIGGTVLSADDRRSLLEILADPTWFGA